MAYIYQITNDVNGKIYIGKTEFSIEKRFKKHCRDSQRLTEEHRPLYAAMRKYGIEHFYIELLEETDNPEEREIYWIEEKGSFKNGYNATLGGDGRKYIDYDLVVATYKEVENCIKVSEMMDIHVDSVRKILHNRGLKPVSAGILASRALGKPVLMLDKDSSEILKSFPSAAEAARYLIDNGKTNCNFKTIRYHVSEVCNKKRKSAAGYKWKYPE